MDFDLKTQCEEEIERRLVGITNPKLEPVVRLLSINDDVLSELMETRSRPREAPSDSFGYVTPPLAGNFDLRWAVRDDDIDLLEKLLSGVTSTAAVGIAAHIFGGVALPPVAIVTALANLFVFFRKLRKKGAKLNELQYEILRGLKHSEEGLTVGEIEAWLSSSDCETLGYEVEATLNELSKFRLQDGNVVALTNSDAFGKWSAAGV